MNRSEQLEILGYAVFDELYPPRLVEELASLLNTHLDGADSEFVFGLLNVIDKTWDIAANPTICNMVRYFLGDDIRIGAVMCKRLKPGANELRIHSDGTEPFGDIIPNLPIMINSITCLSDFTKEGAAFCVLPFSHHANITKHRGLRWFNNEVASGERTIATTDKNAWSEHVHPAPIECKAGSVILWDARLWHGHFPNTSDASRLNLNISYYPKWMNTLIEKNHLPIQPSVFPKMPLELQNMVKHKIGVDRGSVYEVE